MRPRDDEPAPTEAASKRRALATGAAVFGLLLAAGGGLSLVQRLTMNEPEHAEGTVVDYITEARSYRRPIIAFTSKRGDHYRVTSRASGRPAPYSLGQTFDVVYDASDPMDAAISDEATNFGLYLILVGVALCLAPLFVRRLERQEAPTSSAE